MVVERPASSPDPLTFLWPGEDARRSTNNSSKGTLLATVHRSFHQRHETAAFQNLHFGLSADFDESIAIPD